MLVDTRRNAFEDPTSESEKVEVYNPRRPGGLLEHVAEEGPAG